MRSNKETALQDVRQTRRIQVDLPAPVALSANHSLASPSTNRTPLTMGPEGVDDLGGNMESQITLSIASGRTSPSNSILTAPTLMTAGRSSIIAGRSSINAGRSSINKGAVLPGRRRSNSQMFNSSFNLRSGKLKETGSDGSLHDSSGTLRNSMNAAAIMGTSLHRADNHSTSLTLTTTSRKSMTSSYRSTGQLVDEDVNAPTFFFRNVGVLRLDETADLAVKVGDAEHVLRSQCVYMATMMYQFIRDRVYEPGKQYVAILGCGRVGRLVLGSLLDLGWPPESLLVCTRDLNKVNDLRLAGVVCTAKHSALSGIPLVVLAVSPANLREIGEQLTGVLRPETLVVSLLAGVTVEKLTRVLHHELVLKTVVDLRCFPAPWSKHVARHANDFLSFEVRNYSDYFDQAARHMVAAPGYVDHLTTKLRLLAQRLEWEEPQVASMLQEAMYGHSLSQIREEEDERSGDGSGSNEDGSGPVDLHDMHDMQSRYTTDESSSGPTRSQSTGVTTQEGSSGIQRRHERGQLSSSNSSFSSSTSGLLLPVQKLTWGANNNASPSKGLQEAGGHTRSKKRGSSVQNQPRPFTEDVRFDKLEQSIRSLVLPAYQKVFTAWVSEQQQQQQQQQQLLQKKQQPGPPAGAGAEKASTPSDRVSISSDRVSMASDRVSVPSSPVSQLSPAAVEQRKAYSGNRRSSLQPEREAALLAGLMNS